MTLSLDLNSNFIVTGKTKVINIKPIDHFDYYYYYKEPYKEWQPRADKLDFHVVVKIKVMGC